MRDSAVMVTPEHTRMVMEAYTAADLSANEPVDLPLSNRSLSALADIKRDKLEKVG